jgi:hypothetical protein
MPVTLTLLRQLRGVNFNKTVTNVALSGTDPAGNGEIVNLNASSVLNPSALGQTGPNPSDTSLPAVVGACSLGGWQPQLTPIANSPNQFYLTFWNGLTQHTNIAYSALFTGGTLTIEQEWDLGS